MNHPSCRFWFNGWLILLLLAGCSGRTSNATVGLATPLVSPAGVLKASASPTMTDGTPTRPSGLSSTPTPDVVPATPIPDDNVLHFERPVIDSDHVKQLQILAQWSTGAGEEYYLWSPDSTHLLLVSAQVIRMIDVITFQQIWEAPGVDNAMFSQDGSRVVVEKSAVTRILRAADGQVDQSGLPYQVVLPTKMQLPVKDNINGDDFLTVLEDGTHHELHFRASECLAGIVYTDLPSGITGYSLSPDSRLLLITARGTETQPVYQTIVYGINSGLEFPLPAHLSGAEPPGFYATRPGFGVTPLVPARIPPILGQREYPSPIDPPEGSPQNYRLRLLDEPSAILMLQSLAEYGWANDVYGPADGRGSLYNAQEALHMAIQDYVRRFPQSANLVSVQWLLALNNTILKSHESDNWMAAQIEQALNHKELASSLLSLNAGLAPFGFFVDASFKSPYISDETGCDPVDAPPSPLVVNNLMGDHRESLVFMVRTVWSQVGVLFTLTQDLSGQYHVFPVGGQWDVYAGMGQAVQIMDLFGDRQPAIRLDYYWHNGTMNGSNTSFYRWKGKGINRGSFIELSGGIDSGHDGHIIPFRFPEGPGKIRKIVAPKRGMMMFDQVQNLTWNGQKYVSSFHIPLTDDVGDYIEWLEAAVNNHQYSEVVTLIKAQPDDLPWRRFFLGYVEAIQFHPGLARLALQPLADQTKQDPDNALALAAQKFLAEYKSDTDVMRACQAAMDMSQDAYCNPVLITRSFLEWLSRQSSGDLPTKLAGYGIQFSYQNSFDANGDGRKDWLLEQKLPESSQDDFVKNPIWMIISKENGFRFFKLPTHITHISSDSSSTGELEWSLIQLGGGIDGEAVTILMVKKGAYAHFFRIYQEDGIDAVATLKLDEFVSTYQVVEQKDGSRQLVIFHEDTDRFYPPSIYRWNPATGELDNSDYLEHLLFVENNPTEALRILPGMLDYINTHLEKDDFSRMFYAPRMKFFLGLAYELCGDKENAFRTYYDLWKDHPINTEAATSAGAEHYDQPYVIMARARLENLPQTTPIYP